MELLRAPPNGFLLGNLPVRENMMTALASSGDEGEPHSALGLSHNLYLGSQPRVFLAM